MNSYCGEFNHHKPVNFLQSIKWNILAFLLPFGQPALCGDAHRACSPVPFG
jgi:hypothetical protein